MAPWGEVWAESWARKSRETLKASLRAMKVWPEGILAPRS